MAKRNFPRTFCSCVRSVFFCSVFIFAVAGISYRLLSPPITTPSFGPFLPRTDVGCEHCVLHWQCGNCGYGALHERVACITSGPCVLCASYNVIEWGLCLRSVPYVGLEGQCLKVLFIRFDGRLWTRHKTHTMHVIGAGTKGPFAAHQAGDGDGKLKMR